MNLKPSRKMLKKNKRAEMGVGTLIIFIAMILVATVAASVLISTANDLREQAESTGEDAITDVSSGLTVVEMVGSTTADNKVSHVTLFVRLDAGSPSMDMTDVVITNVTSIGWYTDMARGTATDNTHFTCTDLSDTALTTLTDGVLAKITIGDTTHSLNLTASSSITLTITPESGTATTVIANMPDVIPASTTINLM